MHRLVTPLLRALTRWAEQTQQQACRNAMVASTDLTDRRRERQDVQEYVDGLLARRDSRLPAHGHGLPEASRLG